MDSKTQIKQYLSLVWIFLLETALLILLFVSGVYRSVLFNEIFASIAALPDIPVLGSTLILLVMSVPILIIVYLVNFKFFKVSIKHLVLTHGIFIVVCVLVLEILIRSIN